MGVTELQEKMSDEEAARLVRMLVRMGHFSPIEHVTFTFAIEGVSRVLTHQLVRHRIASYSQQSQRYVKEHNFESIMPPAIAAIPEAKAKFEACMQNLQDLMPVRSTISSICAAATARSGKSANWPGRC